MEKYEDFLKNKSHIKNEFGFKPLFMPDYLFDFQKHIVEYAIRAGRSGVFEDCGLGKTIQYLVWAENVVQKTNKRILILTPLAVASQTVNEAEKFGVECEYSKDGKFSKKIVVTNYERIHYFNPLDFVGVVCDESSILKNFDGRRKLEITEFMKKLPYRLLCTATAAPNDYIELGTSSEALGFMGFMDMLNYFFKNSQNTSDTKRHYAQQAGGGLPKWVFKKHAEKSFWQWVVSWAMAIRKPSDIGYADNDFILPELIENQIEIDFERLLPGNLFQVEARGLKEQRQETRATITERCEKVAETIPKTGSFLIWCQLNDEGDLLDKIIPDATQVAGKHSDDEKEKRINQFNTGEVRGLITKSKITGFGMNWQHCNYMTFFPSHSYEQYYQAIRRCWRFGQKKPVTVDIVTTPGMASVLRNLQRKATAADKMFSELVKYINDPNIITDINLHINKQEIPIWL